MMGNDEMGAVRQVNHTPAIALGIAALLLLVVGALSYRDFVRTSLEKEFAEKERQLLSQQGIQMSPYATGQQPAYQQQPVANQPSVAPGNGALLNPAVSGSVPGSYPQAAAPAPQSFQAQPGYNQQVSQSAGQMQIESNLPVPNDPGLESIRDSLEEARIQSERTEQQYREITGNIDSIARQTSEANEEITAELPEFLREAVQ
ncbi:MAG: hypothetical protein AAGC68_15115, partial [Verrucomicrobiota bacterium]